MSSPTAADYGWIRSSSTPFRYALEVGYTLTLVRDVSPATVFRWAQAEPRGRCTGLAGLVAESLEFLNDADGWPEAGIVGVFTVPGEGGDWTLILDLGGDLGSRPRFMEALSAGTRAVSHSSNGGKPMHFFHWYENGRLRTTFETARLRTGTTPDALNTVLTEVGLNPHGDDAPDVDAKAAVFALTERLTGVRLTEELLRDTDFRLGEVPEEPAEEWTGITIDLRDAHGEGTYVRVERDDVD